MKQTPDPEAEAALMAGSRQNTRQTMRQSESSLRIGFTSKNTADILP